MARVGIGEMSLPCDVAVRIDRIGLAEVAAQRAQVVHLAGLVQEAVDAGLRRVEAAEVSSWRPV